MSRTAAEMVQAARAGIREIAGAELPAWREHGSVLADVREPAEYATGHIEGAINTPRGAVDLLRPGARAGRTHHRGPALDLLPARQRSASPGRQPATAPRRAARLPSPQTAHAWSSMTTPALQ
jgi:rhodanese-related sulfurtransferase